MAEIYAAFGLIIFIEWEICDPAEGDFGGVGKFKMVGEGDAELAEDLVDFLAGVGAEEYGISVFGAG